MTLGMASQRKVPTLEQLHPWNQIWLQLWKQLVMKAKNKVCKLALPVNHLHFSASNVEDKEIQNTGGVLGEKTEKSADVRSPEDLMNVFLEHLSKSKPFPKSSPIPLSTPPFMFLYFLPLIVM